MIPDPLPDPARPVAAAAAGELRSLALAVAALGDLEWHSPAAGVYRGVVERLAGRAALAAALLDAAAAP